METQDKPHEKSSPAPQARRTIGRIDGVRQGTCLTPLRTRPYACEARKSQSYCEFWKRWRVVSAPRLAREDVPMKNTGRFRDFMQSFTQFIADVGHEEECLPTAKRFFLSSSPTMIGYPSSLPILIRSAISNTCYIAIPWSASLWSVLSGRRVKKHRCMTIPCGAWWE